MYDLVSLGELLIDFTPIGISDNLNPIFERNPGGGPGNLACAVAKLGGRVAFIGKVGDDMFGNALRDILRVNAVNTDHLILSKEYKTTLAFVSLDSSGDRSFSFYRKNGADTMLTFEEIDTDLIKNTKYLYYSSVLMTEGASRETSFQVARFAKKHHVPTVFDPNLRLNLWGSSADARDCILQAMEFADILKVSEEELLFLTGEEDIKKSVELLRKKYSLKAVLATLGAKGCYAKTASAEVTVSGFSVQTVDTTAAGDSFTGGFLYRLTRGEKDISDYTQAELTGMVRFANAVGALTTTKKGAICALPEYSEVAELLKTVQ